MLAGRPTIPSPENQLFYSEFARPCPVTEAQPVGPYASADASETQVSGAVFSAGTAASAACGSLRTGVSFLPDFFAGAFFATAFFAGGAAFFAATFAGFGL